MPKLLIQLEHYLDANPTKPECYQRFLARLDALEHEYDRWTTVVFDSVTFMELAARRMHQFHLNKKAQHPWQWFAGSTDELEQALVQRAGAMPMSVAVLAHVTQDKDEQMGFILRAPSAPGRLATKQELTAAFSEIYHMNVGRDEEGRPKYSVQTVSDTIWVAQTHIDAPDGCAPTYEALWQSWDGATKPTCKFLVYGPPGTGKSTFASSFCSGGPILVLCFDPFGKEIPYLKRGTVVETSDERGTPVRQVFSKK